MQARDKFLSKVWKTKASKDIPGVLDLLVFKDPRHPENYTTITLHEVEGFEIYTKNHFKHEIQTEEISKEIGRDRRIFQDRAARERRIFELFFKRQLRDRLEFENPETDTRDLPVIDDMLKHISRNIHSVKEMIEKISTMDILKETENHQTKFYY